jgi:hypothetical protein
MPLTALVAGSQEAVLRQGTHKATTQVRRLSKDFPKGTSLVTTSAEGKIARAAKTQFAVVRIVVSIMSVCTNKGEVSCGICNQGMVCRRNT